MVGAAAAETVKLEALVADPLEVTTVIGPVEAPCGTIAVTCASELTVNWADSPLNLTAVVPANPLPVITTDVPGGPLVGLKDAIAGHPTVVTVKFEELVAVPSDVVREMGPVLAPDGTTASTLVELTRSKLAPTPLNLTLLTSLNPEPEIATSVPTHPLVGVNESIDGAGAAAAGGARNARRATTTRLEVVGRAMPVCLICFIRFLPGVKLYRGGPADNASAPSP